MAPGPHIKQFFAEEVRAAAALEDTPQSERVVAAFAAVAREDHVGPGPWLVRSPLFGMASRRTPDANPEHLYHNVLIALDEDQGINIGLPAPWARFFSKTNDLTGASILQVGTGSGYFTAILSQLAGPQGRVLATEIDPKLAPMAERALKSCANVTVHQGNGATDLQEHDGPFDLVVAFAGVTHPVAAWTTRLKPHGQMLLPLTSETWWGAMVLMEGGPGRFTATSLGQCGIFPCTGARDPATAKRLEALWSEPARHMDAKIIIHSDGTSARFSVEGADD